MIIDKRGNASSLNEPLKQLWGKIIPKGCDLAVIHSSLLHLSLPTKGLEEVFVDSIQTLAAKGITLAFPAFTYSFCNGKPFHYKKSRSETGLLADWILKSSGARRTPNPIFSFTVLGPKSEAIISCKNTTTFGADSIFDYFEQANAAFIMLGCGWRNCTQFHKYEEQAKVPYRYFKVFSGQADFGNGMKETQCKMFVRNLDIGVKNDFSTAENALRKKNKILSIDFCKGTVEAVRASDLASVCHQLLEHDPFTWVKDKENILNKFPGTPHVSG